VTPRVFISYAEEDAVTARLVYLRLEESKRVSAWGYKEKGRVGANFEREFQEQIRTCQYFCLLDSPDARRSPWIHDEVALAVRSGSTKVVCRLTPELDESQWRGRELFEGHHLTRAIDLADFEAGIRQLFAFLRIAYNPWSPFPRDQDYDQELRTAAIGVERTQELYDLYREFREHSADRELAESLLRVVIRKCVTYGAAHVISPRLALGVLQGEAGRHDAALRTFLDLAASHPTDPRTWAGVAGAYFHLGEHGRCLEALEECLDVGSRHHPADTTGRLAEIRHNIASVQILLQRYDAAWATLEQASTSEREHPFVVAARGRVVLRRRGPRQALPLLEAASRALGDASPPAVIDLADCYRDLRRADDELGLVEAVLARRPGSPELWHRGADCYLRHGNVPAAIDALRNAVARSEDSPRFRAQLAALLCRAGDARGGHEEAERCIGLAARTAQDRYYRGLAYHVLGRSACAAEEWAASKTDAAVRDWPPYSAL
jgi:tetratricopeptide (TPR) repeat protein